MVAGTLDGHTLPGVDESVVPPVLDDVAHVWAGVEHQVVPPLLEGNVQRPVVVNTGHQVVRLVVTGGKKRNKENRKIYFLFFIQFLQVL